MLPRRRRGEAQWRPGKMAGAPAVRRLRAGVGVLLWACVSAFEWGNMLPAMLKHATDELSDADFHRHLEENSVTAILFYAPWCFYSQQVMPAWDLASQKLQIHDPPVKLAKIDASRYGSIGDEYGVTAFPAIKLFVDGTIFDFHSNQGRGWHQIVKWVNFHIDRDHVLKDVQDAEHFLHDNDLNVVGLFPDGFNHSVFLKSTRHYADVLFAEARGTDVSTQIGEHIARHVALVCETVNIGQSQAPNRSVELPRLQMHCAGDPRNPQRPDWTDKFSASVGGKQLSVWRSDKVAGWDQNLQLKCCDEEDQSKAKYNLKLPAVVMFMPHDERFAIYDGDVRNMHALDRWINARRTPMVARLTIQNAESIFESNPEKIPIVVLLETSDEGSLESVLKEAAGQLRGRATFCVSGSPNQVKKRLMEVSGIDQDHLPIIFLFEMSGATGFDEGMRATKKYRLGTQGLTPRSIVTFLDDYEGGRLKHWMKSEPEPTEEDMSGPVGVLVGSTFTAIAHDTSTDVLIDFYAPWCGHCRKFEPLYKELARNLKHVPSLRIMKLDATRNEVEGMQIMSFPSLILFPAGDKPAVMYQGNREVEDLRQWLHGHCYTAFDDRAPEDVLVEVVESGLLDASEEDL